MNTNIKNSFNYKQDLIDNHLRYLYLQDTSVCLRIQAIEFLYPYIDENNIYEKFKYFYAREKDLYIKNLLKKALDKNLDTYIQTKFDTEQTNERNLETKITVKNLSSETIALLKVIKPN